MIFSLVRQMAPRNSKQFLLNQSGQTIQRGAVSSAPIRQ
jgi:hypothetical protein